MGRSEHDVRLKYAEADELQDATLDRAQDGCDISNIIILYFWAIDFPLLIFSTARPSGSHATQPIADFGPGESSATLLTRFRPPCYRNKSKSAGQERFLADPMGGGSDEITWALNPRSRVQLPDSPSTFL
jgi:hypothetical protein